MLYLPSCKKSSDSNSNNRVKTDYKNPPDRPTVSIYDAVKWGNDEQVHSHFYYNTANLNGEKDNLPLIFVAIAKGHLHIVKQLLSYGVSPNTVIDRQRTNINMMIEYKIPYSINTGELSTLSYAIVMDNIDIVRVLLEKGANPNNTDLEDNSSPLHKSVQNIELTKLLIEAGADVNIKNDHGETPLHYVMDLSVAQTLISSGADVNAKNIFGLTPLHQMARLGFFAGDAATKNMALKIAKALIDSGADVNAKDRDARTPITYNNGCTLNGKSNLFPEFSTLLKQYGGR
jgi:ankyrin repeat protein